MPGPSAAGGATRPPGSGTRSAAQSHAINPVTSVVIPAMMATVEEVEVVVAHHERATLRVGDVFLKIDADQTRTDVEVEAMAMAPIPTPEVLWRKPPALALAALPGIALGHLGEPSTASPAAWAAAGAAARMLHDAPLPPWPGRSIDELASRLDGECEWLVANDVLPADLVTRHRQLAETALLPWTPVFIHGDLQVDHVFVDGDEVTGVLDWSEASQGDVLTVLLHCATALTGSPWMPPVPRPAVTQERPHGGPGKASHASTGEAAVTNVCVAGWGLAAALCLPHAAPPLVAAMPAHAVVVIQ